MNNFMHLMLADGQESAGPLINPVLGLTMNIVLIVLMSLLALFIIAVVLFQPGKSSGIGAITGSSETFFGKNKAKTLEGKMKKLTVIAASLLGFVSVLFFIWQLLRDIQIS